MQATRGAASENTQPANLPAGGLCHVAPQAPLLRLQSVVKALAGAWAQALADASWHLDEQGRRAGQPQLPPSREHHQALALYCEANGLHQVRGETRGGAGSGETRLLEMRV